VLVVDIGHFEIAIAQLTIVSAFTFVISEIWKQYCHKKLLIGNWQPHNTLV